jgi:hypothetical protein
MIFARSPDLTLTSIEVRGVVDGPFPYVGEMPCGGREVLVVVQHHQVMLGRSGADQQIHGRQCTTRSYAAPSRGSMPC